VVELAPGVDSDEGHDGGAGSTGSFDSGGECNSDGCSAPKRARLGGSCSAEAVGVAAGTEQADESESLWRGVNFTFDGRGAGREAGASGEAPGRCCGCGVQGVRLDPSVVCSVCKDQILVCAACRAECAAAAAAAAANNAVAAQEGRGRGAEDAIAESGGGGGGQGHAHAAGGAPFAPADADKGKGGVNFCRRLAAEQASAQMGYECTEHALLGAGWQGFLRRAEAKGLGRARVEGARRGLATMLAASNGRGGKGRRRSLALQLARLSEWLQAPPSPPLEPEVSLRAAASTVGSEPAGSGSAGCAGVARAHEQPSGGGEWAAFFPLLSLWDC
jgi:hypothetical protein